VTKESPNSVNLSDLVPTDLDRRKAKVWKWAIETHAEMWTRLSNEQCEQVLARIAWADGCDG
jgi:hypothetical protein